MASVVRLPSRQQVEDRHPHGHAVRNLLFDHRLQAPRQGRRDLDTLVDGSGVHYERACAGVGQAFFVELVEGGILAQRGQQTALHTFLLQTECHHDFGAFDGAVEVRFDLYRRHGERLACAVLRAGVLSHGEGAEAGRKQRWRSAYDDLGAHRRERPDV